MIKAQAEHHPEGDGVERLAKSPRVASADPAMDRLARIFDAHYALAWRSLRRFGVPAAEVDDAAQEVFMVVARRLADIDEGKERSFVCGTAVRIASDVRRARARRPGGYPEALEWVAAEANLDDLVDQKRARGILDEILDRMPEDQRVVFVMFELEGWTMSEIAEALEVPGGTVASRLRRGREVYTRQVERLERRMEREEA